MIRTDQVDSHVTRPRYVNPGEVLFVVHAPRANDESADVVWMSIYTNSHGIVKIYVRTIAGTTKLSLTYIVNFYSTNAIADAKGFMNRIL